MTKKVISIALVVITIFSMFAITANAAYNIGSYQVNTSSGVNVRSGPGTGYSIVGAASNGVSFTVSKISGSWGYGSIKCTNGTRSGWVCLDNCKYKSSGNSSRTTYNDVFASLKGSGYSLSQARNSEATSFKKGDFVYIWGWVHDANNNLYKSYGSGTINMTLSIYRPDGSCAYTYTYKNSDNNWIGQKLDKAGTWKIQSQITGSLTGTNTRTITVKESSSTTYYTLSYNANGGSGAPSSQTVKSGTGFYLSSTKPTRSGYTFLGWSTSKTATSASYSAGAGVKISSNITLYAVWKKNATVNPTSISLNYSSISISNGSSKTISATVYPSNATNKSVTWSTSNSSVATVSNGKVTAKAPGTATITAKTSNGKTATCKVTVKGIVINSLGSVAVHAGDIYYLSVSSYGVSTSRTWSSSSSAVVSVNSSGKITAKKAGTATITVKTSDGYSASKTIYVNSNNLWKTGNFDSGYVAKGYTTVTLNKNAGNASVKIYSYDMSGHKTSGKMHVTLRSNTGSWIWEGDISSGDSLKLGNDHSQYRVYIAKKQYPNTVIGNGDDFINVGKCYSFAIECKTNCYI